MAERIEPWWISEQVALAVHDRQLAEHGGPTGVRDTGALGSALARPMNRWACGEDDLASLAAAYGFGLARNHPFTDGNKRTAWVAIRLFLRRNHTELHCDELAAIRLIETLAAGDLSENELADWLRLHSA